MPARHPGSRKTLALRQTSPRTAPRWAVDDRSRRDAAGGPGETPRYRDDAERQFRADAGQISRGATRDAGTRAKTAAETRLPAPQAGLIRPRLPIPAAAYMRFGHEATWRSGYATVCKTVYTGSIPVVASTPSHSFQFCVQP